VVSKIIEISDQKNVTGKLDVDMIFVKVVFCVATQCLQKSFRYLCFVGICSTFFMMKITANPTSSVPLS